MDALIRRLDVATSPDPAFASATAALLRPRVRAARVHDMRRIGRVRRDLRLAIDLAMNRTATPRLAFVGLVGLLLLAVLAALIALAGAINRPPSIGNGSLILALDGQLRAFNLEDGSMRLIGPPAEHATRVSRSPDGRLIAFWRSDTGEAQLMIIGADGQGLRRIASDLVITSGDGLGAWSSDSKFVAAEVTVEESDRILVVDVGTGRGRLVTPASAGAHWPLWSPDGRWIAFTRDTGPDTRVLSIIRPDGTDIRDVSGHLDSGAQVDGANSWSVDGAWIYFGATRSIWRADVATATSTRLSDLRAFAVAPALSPDGTLISFLMDTPTNWDLYVANSDGTHAHLVLKDARNNGWSADGHYVLSRWMPADQPGGLTLVSPDGSGFRLVVPAAQACPDPGKGCDMDWGQPKP
jgi:hypothetical protein